MSAKMILQTFCIPYVKEGKVCILIYYWCSQVLTQYLSPIEKSEGPRPVAVDHKKDTCSCGLASSFDITIGPSTLSLFPRLNDVSNNEVDLQTI